MNKTKRFFATLVLAGNALVCVAAGQSNKYTLTYLVDGRVYHTETLEAGAAIDPLPSPSKEGYIFTGWNGITDVMPARDLEVKGSLVLERYSGLSPMKEVKVDSVMYKLTNMTVDDYVNLTLPSLEELYENASHSAQVMYYEYEVNYYSHDIKSARRQPLSWFRLVGTYSYGNTDLAAILVSETTYQVWQQNTSRQKSMFYNIGAAVSIPLYDVFNTRNKVKQWQHKVNQTKARQEAELNTIKEQIIGLYLNIIENISNLKEAFETLVIAQAQYENAETEFINNRFDAEALYRSKSFVKVSKTDYERIKSELNESLLTLEIISCTPIVSSK